METKKSNASTSSQQTGKKRHSSAALGAGMGIASIAGATIGSAFTHKDSADINPEEDVLVDVVPEEEISEEVQQQEQTVEEPVNDQTPTEDHNKDLEKEEEIQNDEIEKEPDDVVDNILNEDNIDDPEFGNEIYPVEMRYITDADGNEVEAMIFADEYGNELALCQSDPGSGIFDKFVDPYTLEEMEMPQELSYTRSDFEEILHDDGGYMPPEPNGSIFADNDDISQDIKTTDDGEMVAQDESMEQAEPDIDINMDFDELDEPEINESDEELIAQMLPDENDEPEVNDDLIDVIEEWFNEDENLEEEPDEDRIVTDEDFDDEDVLDEDDVDEDETDEDDIDDIDEMD